MVSMCNILNAKFWDSEFWIIVAENTFASVLAVIVTIVLFYVTVRKDKKRELKKEEDERNDKLKYFAHTVHNIMGFVNTMILNINECISEIDSQPVSHHPLTIVSRNEIDRVCDKINIESYLLAYTNKFNGDVESFRIIIDSLDYVQAEFKDISLMVVKVSDVINENHRQIHNLFLKSRDIMRAYAIKPDGVNPNVVETNIMAIVFRFAGLGELRTVRDYYESYFQPINQICVQSLAEGRSSALLPQLAENTLDGMELYGLTINENREYQAYLQDKHDKLIKTVAELKIASSKLDTIIR